MKKGTPRRSWWREITRRSVPLAFSAMLVFTAAQLMHAPLTARATTQATTAPDFSAIDHYVEQEMQAMGMPGLALGIVQGEQIVHLQSFGVADPSGRAVTPQTPFIIASTSKSFTALAIMQLVEAGKVELDAPIQRYLPWFRVADAEASARMTVRQLLNQTSGLAGAVEEQYLQQKDTSDGALEQTVRALQTVELSYPPGQTWQYCNLNYSILGLIVQTVAGERYEQYVQAHILAPLGMHNSFASPVDAQGHDLATGYQFWFGRPVATELSYNRAFVPAGFISASAEDMAHYLIAQLNGGAYGSARVLSAAGVAELHRPAIAMSGHWADASYAMGWAVQEISGVPTVWHSGDTADFHADMILMPTRQQGIVLLVNGNNDLQGPRLQAIAPGVLSLLVGRQPPTVPSYNMEALLILFAGLGACVLQILGIARSVVLLRRWRAQPERRPRGARGLALRVGLPLALNLLWVLVCLVVVPQQFKTPLSTLVLVDIGLVVVVSGAVALVWGILRAVLAYFVLRARGASITVKAPNA
jgi:CubicO group peptidase (beta-lactamase class C family)